MKQSRNTKHPWALFAAALSLSAGLLAVPQVRALRLQDADNTKMNKGDANKDASTADQQKMNSSDRATTQKIRAEIMKDKALSTYATTMEVLHQDGKVT